MPFVQQIRRVGWMLTGAILFNAAAMMLVGAALLLFRPGLRQWEPKH